VTESKDRILASIRQSLASAVMPAAEPYSGGAAPASAPGAPVGADKLAQRFGEELEKLSGVLIVEKASAVPALVARLLRERSAQALLAWDGSLLPVPGLLDSLRAEGFRVASGEIPSQEPERSAALTEVEKITVGLTGADAALAETGTLALLAGPGRPRLASLSVTTHIALFTPAELHPALDAWWAARPDLAEWVRSGSHLTLISGPSRTADIEMTLTVGVHGPAEVIAILVR
jgi:L-lactate dehydrogenase complex protein LldG